MDAYLFFGLLFVLALPGLPISIPLLMYLSKDEKHGNSGMVGAAILMTGGVGALAWLIILAFLIGRHLGG